MQQRQVVVTGGAGFIGSHLCEALHASGRYAVTSLDNYFTGSRENHVDGVTYVEGHTKDIASLLPDAPDLVFHLGEYSRVEQSFHDTALVWDLNVHGSAAVIEYCRAHEAKLVYAGSSTKFADGGSGRHQSPYAWSKAINSELVVNYGRWFGLEYAITYFYNVYGPREITAGSYATVLGVFRRQREAGEPLTVVAPGTQRRNFTHVDDIVRGLVLIGEQGQGDEFGLGAEESYSVLEIAQMFGGDITMLPEREGNRMDAPLETGNAGALGWRAEKRVEDYVRDCVQS
ncbi:MAG: NAD-dependent epimerase/dehydratase family protein [Planctomycetota bacterium]|nr:NAD-dependent epimerase/dehydratase family protein [Planctomycetota bacterium]